MTTKPSNPFFCLIKNYWLTALGFACLATTFINSFVSKFNNILNSNLNVHHRGDEGPRVLDTALYSTGVTKLNWPDFLSIHPPFDIVFRSWVSQLFNSFDSLNDVQVSILISLLIHTLIIVTILSIVKQVLGWLPVFFLGLLLFNSKSIDFLSMRVLGETFSMVFLTLGFLLLRKAKYNNSNNHFLIIVSALLFLFSSFFRTEVLFILPFLCLFLFFSKNTLASIIFAVVGSSYTLIKILITKFFYPDMIQYTNAHKDWYFQSYNLSEILSSRFINNFLFKDTFIVIWVSLLAFLIIKLTKKSLPLPNKDNLNFSYILLISSIGMMFLLGLSGFSGFSHLQQRLLAAPFVLFYLGFIFLFSEAIKTLAKLNYGKIILSMGLVFLTFSASTNTSIAIETRTKLVPSQVSELKTWLKQNLNHSDVVLFDYLYYYEWFYRANLTKILDPIKTCSYNRCGLATSNKVKLSSLELVEMSRTHPNEAEDIQIAWNFILSNQTKPMYLVLMTKNRAQKIGTTARRGSLTAYSMFYPKMTEYALNMNNPIAPEDLTLTQENGEIVQIKLIEKYRNSWFKVFQSLPITQ